MAAGLRLDQLQRGTHGVGGGIGRAAEQGVDQTHLDEHRAEVVALGKCRAAVLFAHLALAQFHHLGDHLVHALIGSRVDDCGLADAEIALSAAALTSSTLPMRMTSIRSSLSRRSVASRMRASGLR